MCANCEYFSDVSCRRAGCLTEVDNDDALPYCIAAGNIDLAIQHLTSRGHLLDAVLVAAAADEGGIPSVPDKSRQRRLRRFHTEENCGDQTRFAKLHLSPQICCHIPCEI